MRASPGRGGVAVRVSDSLDASFAPTMPNVSLPQGNGLFVPDVTRRRPTPPRWGCRKTGPLPCGLRHRLHDVAPSGAGQFQSADSVTDPQRSSRQHRCVTRPTTARKIQAVREPLGGRCQVAYEVGTQASGGDEVRQVFNRTDAGLTGDLPSYGGQAVR